MADNRFPSPGVDARFTGTDVRFPSPGTDARFSGGLDTRFQGPTYGGGGDPEDLVWNGDPLEWNADQIIFTPA